MYITGAPLHGHRGKVIKVNTGAGSTTVIVEGKFGFEPVDGASEGPDWPEQRLYLSDAQLRVTDARGAACGTYGQGTDCRFPQQGELTIAASLKYNAMLNVTRRTLKGSLQYPHVQGHASFLTRNVVFRSANPNQLMRRGHVMFAGNTRVALYGVAFEDLGRTTTAVGRSRCVVSIVLHIAFGQIATPDPC